MRHLPCQIVIDMVFKRRLRRPSKLVVLVYPLPCLSLAFPWLLLGLGSVTATSMRIATLFVFFHYDTRFANLSPVCHSTSVYQQPVTPLRKPRAQKCPLASNRFTVGSSRTNCVYMLCNPRRPAARLLSMSCADPLHEAYCIFVGPGKIIVRA